MSKYYDNMALMSGKFKDLVDELQAEWTTWGNQNAARALNSGYICGRTSGLATGGPTRRTAGRPHGDALVSGT